MFGNYSKLVAALLGNVVAIVIAYAATRFPLVASCTEAADQMICTALGYNQQEITIGLMALLNTVFVWRFPPNRPSKK